MTESLWNLAMPWGSFLVALVGAAVAALANGAEMGLYRLNPVRLRLRATQGDRRAAILQVLLGDLRGMIIVCLIGTNIGVFIATAVATALVESSGWVQTTLAVEILTTVIVTPLLFVFADVVPKSIFAVEADHWMYPLAAPLRWVYGALCRIGLIAILKGISGLILRLSKRRGALGMPGADPFTPRQRLRAIIREGVAEGVISGYQDELVEKVLHLREQPVWQVMIALAQVAAVPVDIRCDAFIAQLREHSFTRLPVYDGRKENVVGIVRISEVLAAEDRPFDLGRLMSREFLTVAPDMTVSQAMFQMRKARAAMAVVRDAKERAVGIITLKDLVEEIVGELAAW